MKPHILSPVVIKPHHSAENHALMVHTHYAVEKIPNSPKSESCHTEHHSTTVLASAQVVKGQHSAYSSQQEQKITLQHQHMSPLRIGEPTTSDHHNLQENFKYRSQKPSECHKLSHKDFNASQSQQNHMLNLPPIADNLLNSPLC